MSDLFTKALSAATEAMELGTSAMKTSIWGDENANGDSGQTTVRTISSGKSIAATKSATSKGKLDTEEGDGGDADEEQVADGFGRLEFQLDYNFDKGILQVTVIQAVDLPGMDASGTSDPYCKLYVSPDTKKTFETKKFKKTLNPVFNQTFTFSKLPFTEIPNKTLVFGLFDHDAVGSDDQIGEVQVPLSTVDLAAENLQMWRTIKEPPVNTLGEICCSLRYVPKKNQLTCMIIECKALKAMDVLTGASDPYVKVNLMQGGKRVKKVKTAIKMKNLNPYYNESFKFEVRPSEMAKTELVLVVMDYDRVGSNDAIGCVKLGRNSEGTAIQHWKDMVQGGGRSIAQWHCLVPMED